MHQQVLNLGNTIAQQKKVSAIFFKILAVVRKTTGKN
jgi:hypothetical protein